MNNNEKYSIRNYDKIAQKYDNSFDGKFTAKFKNKMLEFCEVSDGDKVLDVGCGNGRLIHAISQKSDIKAYGIDISPNMIAECRIQYEGINFEVSNGEQLNFDKNSIDMVTICCVLHHLNTAQNFIKEAYRILKTDGVLIICEPWLPFGVRHFTDWIISPILRAGDNKIFSHKRIERLVTSENFEITEFYKKGVIQIIKAKKI